MQIVSTYVLYFFIYAFLGWLLEVICKFVEYKRFINRGFLVGPICPIYGFGVLGIILLIGKNTSDVLAVFLKSILICSILEYFTSYIMEKLFKARWWDYSKRKYNINGRICLETMIPFGVLGVGIIYLLHPTIVKFVGLFGSTLKLVCAIILCVIFIVDLVFSYNVMNKIKKEIKNHNQDNTELIKEKVIEWLNNNSTLYRHVKNAYPKFKISKRLK